MSIEAASRYFPISEVNKGLTSRTRGVGLRIGRVTLIGAMWVVGCPGDDIIVAAAGSTPSNSGQAFGMRGDELVARFNIEKDLDEKAQRFGKFSSRPFTSQTS